jgi:type II secretory pathway pseudopilin PulG
MKKSAFTLMELLVVVSIIIVLIGLTSSGVMVALKKTKENRAKTEVMNILTAVKLYQSEVGVLPNKITEKFLGIGLSKKNVYGSGDDTKRFGPYYEFKTSNSKGPPLDDRDLQDPWDKPYKYVMANDTVSANYNALPEEGKTAVKNGFSVVYSYGTDGEPDTPDKTSDNIATWQ